VGLLVGRGGGMIWTEVKSRIYVLHVDSGVGMVGKSFCINIFFLYLACWLTCGSSMNDLPIN
jgi:hypothetical protein